MDPQSLVDTASAGTPAPLWFFWFVEFFKWLGFTLHTVPMNLWYAGLIIALGLHLRGGQHARQFAARLLRQMPIIVALGVNFGIVPLLFVQLAYHKVFYPATILMAWSWLAIIALLIPAYYGVYAYEKGVRNLLLARWRVIAGWCAAAMFIVIGFIFANGLSLMEHVYRWPALWQDHSQAGAALGTALNVGDRTLLPRWLMMFCLAIGTTAVWLLVDTFLLTGQSADEAYRQWAFHFARHLYTFGMVWGAATGAWYVFLGWTPELRSTMFSWPLLGWPLLPLTLATAVAPGLPWLLMMTAGRWSQKRVLVALIALSQFGVLGINAASRQIVQHINLQPFLDIPAQLSDAEIGPLAMFLIVFAIGLAVIGWMLVQISRSCLPDGTS
jgi:hypothetical protein